MILSSVKTKQVAVFGFVLVQFSSCAIEFKVIPSNPLSKKANCVLAFVLSWHHAVGRKLQSFLGWQGRSWQPGPIPAASQEAGQPHSQASGSSLVTDWARTLAHGWGSHAGRFLARQEHGLLALRWVKPSPRLWPGR